MPPATQASEATSNTVREGAGTEQEESVVKTTDNAGAATDPPNQPDEEALKSAVEEYVAAFGNGEPDAAVSFLSQRCIDTVPLDEYQRRSRRSW